MKRVLLFALVLLLVTQAAAQEKEEEAARYLETLIQSVREGNDPMRNRMFIKLRVLGNVSVGPILEALGDETPEVRHYLAFTLGFLDDARVLQPLLDLFRQDPEVMVRCAAAEALGRLERPEAVNPLIEALSDPNDKIRQSAAYSLGLIGNPEARPALEKAKEDTDELIRFFAEDALVQIERAEARRNR